MRSSTATATLDLFLGRTCSDHSYLLPLGWKSHQHTSYEFCQWVFFCQPPCRELWILAFCCSFKPSTINQYQEEEHSQDCSLWATSWKTLHT